MTLPATVRWGFLGAGVVASRALAPAVHSADRAVLQVVASRDAHRAARLQPTRVCDSYEAVCRAEDVDVVYISLPNADHLRWVLPAIESGKHVLCEKPLGMNAAEVAQMEAASLSTGARLVEAAWNRWHPRTRRVGELLAAVNEPVAMRAWFTFAGVPVGNYRLDPARGGGALLDVGCYAVAAALIALGDAVEVEAAEQKVGVTGADMTTSATLTSLRGRAEVTASFELAESQGWTIETPWLHLDVEGPSFTSWREPSRLRVVENGVERLETFESCDAYRLMVDSVSDLARGLDAWVLPLSTSLAVAQTLDRISAVARAE